MSVKKMFKEKALSFFSLCFSVIYKNEYLQNKKNGMVVIEVHKNVFYETQCKKYDLPAL